MSGSNTEFQPSNSPFSINEQQRWLPFNNRDNSISELKVAESEAKGLEQKEFQKYNSEIGSKNELLILQK